MSPPNFQPPVGDGALEEGAAALADRERRIADHGPGHR